ncbi:MAG: hypothetical protein OEU44_06320 [Gammaproteobacteria bacterium]|nr:hypothetical protein [Gammaproteobacteria bacterium]
MQSRILQSILLAANSSLFAPLVQAHVGEHASSSPIESFVHLLTSTDHWLGVSLWLVSALALYYLLKLRSSS